MRSGSTNKNRMTYEEEMMNLTTPDIIIIIIITAVTVVIAMLLVHWPNGYDNRKALFYKLGVNALRLSWEGGKGGGLHEMKIMLARKGEEFPTVGDTLIFMESDQTTWRGVIQRIQVNPDNKIPRGKPTAIVWVVAK